MAGKLNFYAIGQGGVNVVKSPIRLTNDECRSAQNAIFAPAAEGGLEKRGSLTRLNSSALNSGANVLAIANVGLPNPYNTTTLVRKYLYAALTNYVDATTWVRSADGTTWSTVSTPTFQAFTINNGLWAPAPFAAQPPPLVPGYFLYTPASNTNAIYKWDNTTDDVVLTLPYVPEGGAKVITSACIHNGSLYVCTSDDVYGRVHKIDTISGEITVVGGKFPDGVLDRTPWGIWSYNGLLWAGGSIESFPDPTVAAQKVWRINPDTETTWTADSATLNGYPVSIASFLGSLYIGTASRAAGTSMNVYKRTASGTYSTVLTDASPWNAPYGTQLIVFNSTLFAYVGGNIHKSTDGSAWSVDLDVYTTYTNFTGQPGVPIIFDNALYWAFAETSYGGADGRILKRTTGGTWSSVYTGKLQGPVTTLVLS